MNSDTISDVVLADREMEQPTKDALRALTDAVEHWGATTYHRHVTDVRQQVESDMTRVLDDVLVHLERGLGTITPIVAQMPTSEPQGTISRELASLQGLLESAHDRRRRLTAEGLGQTAASIAAGETQ